jgi:hypothetical protein
MKKVFKVGGLTILGLISLMIIAGLLTNNSEADQTDNGTIIPDIQKVKEDLIGRQVGSWQFDKLEEFSDVKILNQTNEDENTLFLNCELSLIDNNTLDLYEGTVDIKYTLSKNNKWLFEDVTGEILKSNNALQNEVERIQGKNSNGNSSEPESNINDVSETSISDVDRNNNGTAENPPESRIDPDEHRNSDEKQESSIESEVIQCNWCPKKFSIRYYMFFGTRKYDKEVGATSCVHNDNYKGTRPHYCSKKCACEDPNNKY